MDETISKRKSLGETRGSAGLLRLTACLEFHLSDPDASTETLRDCAAALCRQIRAEEAERAAFDARHEGRYSACPGNGCFGVFLAGSCTSCGMDVETAAVVETVRAHADRAHLTPDEFARAMSSMTLEEARAFAGHAKNVGELATHGFDSDTEAATPEEIVESGGVFLACAVFGALVVAVCAVVAYWPELTAWFWRIVR